MDVLILILTMIGVSLLGSLLFSVIKAGKYFRPGVFSWAVFYKENKYIWLYSLMVSSLIAIIINVVPSTADAIRAATGLAVAKEIASFLTLGYALCASLKSKKDVAFRNSIGGGGHQKPPNGK